MNRNFNILFLVRLIFQTHNPTVVIPIKSDDNFRIFIERLDTVVNVFVEVKYCLFFQTLEISLFS